MALFESISGQVAEQTVSIDVSRGRLSQRGKASNGTNSCIHYPARTAETTRSRKVCVLVVRFRQDNVLENSDDPPKNRLPNENSRTWGGKRFGSTAGHTADELLQHKFGTRVAYPNRPAALPKRARSTLKYGGEAYLATGTGRGGTRTAATNVECRRRETL